MIIHRTDAYLLQAGLPTTFAYRPCCLDSFQQNMSFGESKTRTVRQSYHVAMMRDAIDITYEPKQRSLKHQLGWLFSQFYASYKELFDAGKTKLFHGWYLLSSE